MVQSNLKKIEVSGFKSINRLSLEINDVNILIGANGAGKSNFISVFTFLGRLSRGQLKSYVSEQGGGDQFLHFGSRTTNEIKLRVDVGNNSYVVCLAPSISDDSLFIKEEHCEFDPVHRVYPLDSRNGESGLAKVSGPYGVPQYTKKYLDKCRAYHFHDTSKHAGYKKTAALDANHYLETDAGNLAPLLYSFKNSVYEEYRKSYEQIVSAIKTIAPFFDDFYLEPVGDADGQNIRLRWIQTGQQNPFSANALSDGTARFICMAALFLQPEVLRPATIILDEPELGLHPAALIALADIIKSVSKETQVICSTQSITFANQFDVEAFIVVDAKNGVSAFKKPSKEDLKLWLEDYGMGDIWAKNLIGGRPEW